MNAITEKAIQLAGTLVGTLEVPPNSNRGVIIDDIQKLFGLKGQQYCVMFCLFVYYSAIKWINATKGTSIKFPLIMTASSQTLFEDAKKKGFVYTDPFNVKAGDIVIWRKFKLWQGHAGLIASAIQIDRKGIYFTTIEGNTQTGIKGDQRDGGGIFKRVRYANKLDFSPDAFYIRGFIDMEKALAV